MSPAGWTRTPGRRAALVLAGLMVVSGLVPFGFAVGAPSHPGTSASAGPAVASPTSTAAPVAPRPATAPSSGPGTFWVNQLVPPSTLPSCAYQTTCLNDTGDPSIVSTSGGVLAVAYTAFTNSTACPAVANDTLTQIGFTVSTNGGSTWSTPALLDNTNCTNVQEVPSAMEPSLAVLGNGTLVLAYIEYNVTATYSCSGYIYYPALNPCFINYDDLVVRYSSNNGTSWTAPQVLNATNNSGLASNAPMAAQPDVATAGSTIYLAWTNFSYPEYDQPGIAPSIGANLLVSNTSGATWQSARTLPVQPGLWGSAVSWVGYAPRLIVNATGTLFATYATDLNTVSGNVCSPYGCAAPFPAATESVVVARSTNNGTGFSVATLATGVPIQWNGGNWANGGPGSFVSPAPAIAIDPSSGQLYVAYAGGETGTVCFAPGSCSAQESFVNVWVSNSTDGGATWSSPVPLGDTVLGLAGGATQANALFLPSIGVGANGTVYVDVGQQNVSACVGLNCGLQSDLVFVSTDHGASFPNWYTPYPSPTVNDYPLWDGIQSSMTVLGGVPFMAWTLEVCPGSGASGYCGAPSTISWSQVVVTSPFDGTGVTVSFTETGVPAGTNWSVSLSGNVRSGGPGTTLKVSGVPTGLVEAWSAAWLNSSGYGLVYVPNTTVVSPGTFAANTTVPYVYTENAQVTISTVPPGFPGYSFNCPPGSTFSFDCASLSVGPFVGTTYEPVGGSLPYGISPGPTPMATCGQCLNVSFLRWTGTGAGSWNSSVANGTTTIRGPVNETATFTLWNVCNYGICTNATYSYTFAETGLPNGTAWSVTLGNQTGSASGPLIGFNDTQGPLNFTVWVVPHNATWAYYGTASSPSPVSYPTNTAVVVTFTLRAIDRESAVLTAAATGLPAGVPAWGLSFGSSQYSVSGNASFAVADGPVNLSAGPVYGPNDIGAYPTGFEVSPEVVGAVNSTLAVGGTLNVTGPVRVTAQYAPDYRLSVSSTAGGNVSGSDGAWVHSGAPVNLSASPSAGFAWVGWSGVGAGSYTGTLENITVHPTAPVTELATFVALVPTFTINVSASGIAAGTPITVSFGSRNYTEPAPFLIVGVAAGAYVVRVPTVYPNATSGVRYLVASVTSSLSLVGDSLSVGASGTLTIGFAEQVTLTVGPAVNGTTSPAAGTYWEAAGAPLTLTETPDHGFSAAGWTGTTASSNASLVYSPTTPQIEAAQFAAIPPRPLLTYNLTLTETGIPSGVAWSAAVGATGLSGTGPLVFPGLNGSVAVTIATVLGAVGVRFVPPGAGSYSENVTTDRTLPVQFTTQYYVSVTAGAGGNATPGSAWVNADGTVTLDAAANGSSAFVNWSGWGPGAYNGTSPTKVLTVSGPVQEVATFGPKPASGTSSASGLTTYGVPVAVLVVLLVVGLAAGIALARSRGRSPPPEEPPAGGPAAWSEGEGAAPTGDPFAEGASGDPSGAEPE